MYTKVVNVLSNSGTGTQDITFTPNGSDPSWTPKVAIFQWSRANTSTGTFQEHMSYGFGFTDGTNQRCVSISSEDNSARSDTGSRGSNNSVITALIPTGTLPGVDAVATFSSWLTNGIQINWTDAPAAQFYITVTFLGGDDITNAAVGTIMSGTSVTTISETGLNFQPDFGLFISQPYWAENTNISWNGCSIGAATDSSHQWVQSQFTTDNAGTMDTCSYYSHSKVWANHYTTTSLDGYATFSSFNSNGFTLSVDDAPTNSTYIYYLVIKGGSFAVGNDTEPGSTGTQTITTNKNTKAVMVFGLDTGTADSLQAGCLWISGIGTASGTGNQFNIVFEDTNGVADSIVVSRINDGYIYYNITANATATSSTSDDYANLSTVSSTGFSIYWLDIGQARPYRYLTFGTGVNVYNGPISEDSVSVGDGSAVRVLIATRPISDTPTVSVSDSAAGAKLYSVSISEPSVSVGPPEEVEGEREVERAITDTPTVSVSDSVAKAVTYPKPISNEDPISVSESIDREADYTRSID